MEKEETNSKRGKHFTSAEKAEILTLYEKGGFTQKQIAQKLGRDPISVGDILRKAGAKKGSRSHEMQEEVDKKITAELFDNPDIIAKRVRETKEEHYKINSGLAKIVWASLAKASNNGNSVSTILDDIKAYKFAAELFRITRTERFAALGFREEEDYQDKPMPELVVKELTAEEIQEMRKREAIEAADDLVLADVDFRALDGDEEDGIEIGDQNERIEVGFDEEEEE